MHIQSGKPKFNKPSKPCPACNAYDKPKGGIVKTKKGKFGKFLSCSRYPLCKWSESV